MTVENTAEEPRRSRFYDVQRVLEHFEKTGVKPSLGLLSRVTRPIWSIFDGVQGIIIILAGGGLFIFSMSLVTVGLLYGPLLFLAGSGGLLLVLSFIIERKVGRSLQFGEYSVLRRGFAQALAFAAFLGLIFLMLFVSQTIT